MEDLLSLKVEGSFGMRRDFLAFPCSSQRKVALAYQYGNLCFPVGKRLPVLDYSYYDRGQGYDNLRSERLNNRDCWARGYTGWRARVGTCSGTGTGTDTGPWIKLRQSVRVPVLV